MKDIKNVQEINDIELTEEELDQVQGGVVILAPLAVTAGTAVLAKLIKWLRKK